MRGSGAATPLCLKIPEGQRCDVSIVLHQQQHYYYGKYVVAAASGF